MIEKDENFLRLIEELKALGALGMKLELESEYLPEEKCFEISKALDVNNFNLILKLGGLSSFNDICIAKNVCAHIIVAPMVESAYGLEKFVKTLFCVYSEEEVLNKKIYINIETKTGLEKFQDILLSKYIKYITGVVIGRSDLSSSLEVSEALIDSDKMYETIYPVVEKCYREGKKVIMGGKITPASVSFLKKIPANYLYGFETRKILFKSSLLQDKTIEEVSFAINKAIEFELYYLQNFSKKVSKNTIDIDKRILALKNRCLG